MSVVKYNFSGHESFPCKSLWLKKGYDFVVSGNQFSSAEAVMELGVGKKNHWGQVHRPCPYDSLPT